VLIGKSKLSGVDLQFPDVTAKKSGLENGCFQLATEVKSAFAVK